MSEVTHRAYCVEEDCDWSKDSNERTAESMARDHRNVEGHSVNVVPIEELETRQLLDPAQEIILSLTEIENLNLATLQNISHSIAAQKGWHDEERTFGDYCSLFHSEISEALEEHREGNYFSEIYYISEASGNPKGGSYDSQELSSFPMHEKPEGIPIELADVLIRILDFCGKHDIDLMAALKLKLMYNLGRDYRHGGKEI